MTFRGFTALTLAGLMASGLLSPPVSAQQPPGPSPCITDPHFRDFDFWIGEWAVTNRANGNLAGTNKITSIEGSCALEERWTSANGGTGMSINYYNPLSEEWRQIWVSGGAYTIDVVGGLDEDGAMVLEGTIFYFRNGKNFPFRGTWTANDDGSVRQYFQQGDAESGEWSDWFDGLYKPLEGGAKD